MARKKIRRNLARLPQPSLLHGAHHKSDRLLEILREVAIRNQQEQPQAFHPVREIAARFRVTLSTVARVYGELEREGLISRVRGSQTTLQGLHFDRRLRVRAFVGLPACLPTFVTIQDYRTFFIRIRRELRFRGFATAMALFQPEELRTGLLSDRLKRYEVDTVLWFLPPPNARNTLLRLADLGIRLLGMCDGTPSVIACRYQVQRENAIRELLTEWKSKFSAHTVTVVESREMRSPGSSETLHTILHELGMDSVTANYKQQRTDAFIGMLIGARTDGIIFPSSTLASRFCCRRPSAVTKLLKSRRVAFLEGPVSMPFAKVPDVRVDLITVNWQLVAEAIVDDLVNQDAFRPGHTVFEAEAHLRVPLSRFAENI